jgi:alginate O-acetyltransferase complex protein AlgI
MLCISMPYFIFFVLYFTCFWFLKPGYRLHLATIGSLVFYGWLNLALTWIPIVLSIIAFWGTSWILKTENQKNKSTRLWMVIVTLLTPLIYLKYQHFLYNEILVPKAGIASIDLRTVLPLGISFMTFTIISYVVDVYRKKFLPSHSFSHVLTYLLFFPHLIAGPILRPSELIPQLSRTSKSRLSSVGFGIMLLTLGLIKKVIFADSLSNAVDPVYADPTGHSLATYWLAIWGYTLQIYCDFSGYTDMAIGSATILGIRLPYNFHKPYLSCSLQNFWRCWHMTLSRWLRDYIYLPLGGSRCSKPRYIINIIITMALCGVWHGANWTFLIWGMLHGLGLAVIGAIKFSTRATRIAAATPYLVKWLLTFNFLALTWVVFRSPDLSTAKIILTGAFAAEKTLNNQFLNTNIFYLVLIGLFAILHRFDSMKNIRFAYRKSNKIILGVFIVMTGIITFAASTVSSKSFIYLDF